MAQDKAKATKWRDPEKVDSAIGYLIIAVVGGVVFVFLGRNLVPYAQLFSKLAAAPIQGFLFAFVLRMIARVFGALVGVILFTGIQLLEVRPQMLRGRLPQGEKRAKKLRNAWTWFLIAFALDIFFCFLFWPPVASDLGWGVFRGGFAWGLLDWWNIAQTFFTLFGGILLVATINSVRKHW